MPPQGDVAVSQTCRLSEVLLLSALGKRADRLSLPGEEAEVQPVCQLLEVLVMVLSHTSRVGTQKGNQRAGEGGHFQIHSQFWLRVDQSQAGPFLSCRALIPLFDPSTGLLVLAGKGENVLSCYEVLTGQPALTEVNQCLTEAKSQGVAQVPKLALDVMACEVMRVLQLTDCAIVPVSYVVPRKVSALGRPNQGDGGVLQSTQEFHQDLFPDCTGNVPAASAQSWWSGDNSQVENISLHPALQQPRKAFISNCVPPFRQEAHAPASPCSGGASDRTEDLETSAGSSLSSPTSSLTSPSSAAPSLSITSGFASSPSQRSLQSILGPSSGFRHLQGTVLHRKTHITNLRGLSLTTPGECDGFCANPRHVAIPLLSAGGQVAILELSKPGRLPDTAMPTIQNGAPVSDLCWDPFDLQHLAIAGEDGKIRLWRLEPGGLQKMLLEPEVLLQGHTEKIYSIKFHPLASDILASSSYDMSVRIWDVGTRKEVLKLGGHRDQIFSLAWSPDGRRLATVSKDSKVRVYEPRLASDPLQEGPGPEGSRGARVVWVCGGKCLLISGFDSRSERQLSLYGAESVATGPVVVLSLDVAPSTLIPFYDPDTSVVFLTGKGDTRVFVYEVVPEAPFFLECNSFLSSEPHKGFQFLPKTECDVREVEVARALRLRQSSMEPVAFRVPRVKKEFFQDDLFPPTEVWWEPALSAKAWLGGSDRQHRKLSLQPKDMAPVSEAPKDPPSRKYLPSSVYLEEKSDEQKKEELLSAMVAKLGNRDDPLPQDSFEGVDEDEWVRVTNRRSQDSGERVCHCLSALSPNLEPELPLFRELETHQCLSRLPTKHLLTVLGSLLSVFRQQGCPSGTKHRHPAEGDQFPLLLPSCLRSAARLGWNLAATSSKLGQVPDAEPSSL
ncbi:hypothetical protein JD844_020169 [Phrynosoma platyrhinos]|uniref:Coronin n=1 Tax=Phrynosoma platyrhinos TaxID=52577 RepID=A0ABQ7TS67_PHRPL|nr:hypothetical protein JD844_020169 [Phrynosoma platyrhinos]